jgi:hypothetical protein
MNAEVRSPATRYDVRMTHALVFFAGSWLGGCGDDATSGRDAGPRADGSVGFDAATVLDGSVERDSGPRIDAFAPDAGAAGWRAEPSLPVALQEISAAVIDDRIYVAGGFEGLTVVDTVRIYDPRTGEWSTGPALPARLHHLALVALDGDLYSLGGMSPGGFSAVDDAYVLRAGASAWEAIAPLPAPRAAMAAGAIDGRIYVGAGQGRGGDLIAEALEYDPAENTWTERAAMGDPREHVAGFAYGGELWVIGGRDLSLGSATDSVEIYDPAANSWRAGPSLNTTHGGCAAAVFGDVAILVGGERPSEAMNEVERIDLPGGAWELVDPIPTRRHGHAMAATLGRFYVIGGGDAPIFAAVDTVESFAP